jgi:type I restriction enzyme S subunit
VIHRVGSSLSPLWNQNNTVRTSRAFLVRTGKMLQREPSDPADREVPYLKAVHVQDGIIVLGDELPTMWASPADIAVLSPQPGDLLVCEGGQVGRSAIVIDGAIPPSTVIEKSLHLVRPRRDAVVGFLNYVLSSARESGWLDVVVGSATLKHLTGEALAALRIPLPTVRMQRGIADYLDRETARIDALISAKQRQVALTSEGWISLLVHTLVPIPIPEQWDRTRLKYLFEPPVAGTWGEEPQDDDNDVLCVRVADFDREGFVVRSNADTVRSITCAARLKLLLHRGDVLLEKSGGGEGQPVGCSVQFTVDRPAVSSNFIARLRPQTHIQGSFAALLLAAVYSQGMSVPFIRQTTGIQNLDVGAYLGQATCVPPRSEQEALTSSLMRMYEVSKSLTQTLEQEVAVLTERRQALITAAVTGELGIPEAAA